MAHADDHTEHGNQPLMSHSIEAVLVGWLKRTAGLVMLLAALALWISLVSWSKSDPSLTHTADGAVRNLLGHPGAIISDVFLQLLGVAAVLMLIAPIVWGLQLVNREEIPGLKVKCVQWLLAVGLLATGLSALPVAESWPFEHGFGGFGGDVGHMLSTGLIGLINQTAASFAAGLISFASGAWLAAEALGLNGRDLRLAWASPRRRPSTQAATDSASHAGRAWAGLAGHAARVAGGLADMSSAPTPAPAKAPLEPRIVTPDRDRARHTWHDDIDRDLRARDTLDDRPLDDDDAARDLPLILRNAIGKQADERRAPTLPLPPLPDAIDADFAANTDHARDDADGAPRSAPAEKTPMPSDHRAVGAAESLQSPQSRPESGPESRPLGRTPTMPTDVRDGSGPEAWDGVLDPALFDCDRRMRETAQSEQAANPNSAPGAAPSGAGTTQARAAKPQQIPLPLEPAQPRSGAPTPAPAPAHAKPRGYAPPSLALLSAPDADRDAHELDQTILRGNAGLLEDVLSDFGVKAEVREIRPGPVITLYEIEIARGIKASRVIGLADDIARSMSAPSARVAVIPGRNTLGIELPNVTRETVHLSTVIASPEFGSDKLTLPIALGSSIDGEPVVRDLARMPHLLVAGTTGSGKSVGVNAMILSLIYRHGPERLRFVMIDPKMLELSVYNDIPHLLTPVVTDPGKAVTALEWVVREMEERYKRMSELGVRNIAAFNRRVSAAAANGETLSEQVQTGFAPDTGAPVYETRTIAIETLPHIVVVVDEFADLMMVAGKEVDGLIQRIAQMARAAGIHLIMATQRPSVDVVTGTIKANFPCRIGFKVASKVDSRTILNEQGAEQLLGQGDMLVSDGSGRLTRVHGAFVSDEEVEAVAADVRARGKPSYVPDVIAACDGQDPGSDDDAAGSSEDLFDRAVAIVVRDRKPSISYIQRRLSIGYNRAADLVERMEAEGIVSAPNASNKREILIDGQG